MVSTMRARRAAPNAPPPGMGTSPNDLCAMTRGDLLDVLFHGRLPPFLALRSPGRRGLFQRKADLEVKSPRKFSQAIDHEQWS